MTSKSCLLIATCVPGLMHVHTHTTHMCTCIHTHAHTYPQRQRERSHFVKFFAKRMGHEERQNWLRRWGGRRDLLKIPLVENARVPPVLLQKSPSDASRNRATGPCPSLPQPLHVLSLDAHRVHRLIPFSSHSSAACLDAMELVKPSASCLDKWTASRLPCLAFSVWSSPQEESNRAPFKVQFKPILW